MRKTLLSVLSILFVATLAHAENYSYTALATTCRLSGTRQAISAPVREIGKGFSTTFGVQLFRSDGAYPARITALTSGSGQQVYAALKGGGVPNPAATRNWAVDENKTEVIEDWAFPGTSVSFPLDFKLTSSKQRDDVVVSSSWLLSLSQLREILQFLGEASPPDFKVDPPTVTIDGKPSTGPYPESFTLKFLGFEWSVNPFGLERKLYWEQSRSPWTVQLHYPASKFQGLSYHISASCNPVHWQ